MKQKFVQIEKRNSLEREECVNYVNELSEKVFDKLISEPILLQEFSGRLEESFLTPKDSPIPDCLSCGVCCASAFCVEVLQSDSTPREYYWEVKIKGQNREILVDKVMRSDSETGRCVALEGELGKSISCKIYEDRPTYCHLFDAGSDKCHALRRAFGLEPPLTKDEILQVFVHLMQKPSASEDDERIRHVFINETDKPDICQIKVITVTGREVNLHKYNALEEVWLESDFNTLSIEQAKKLIINRQ